MNRIVVVCVLLSCALLRPSECGVADPPFLQIEAQLIAAPDDSGVARYRISRLSSLVTGSEPQQVSSLTAQCPSQDLGRWKTLFALDQVIELQWESLKKERRRGPDRWQLRSTGGGLTRRCECTGRTDPRHAEAFVGFVNGRSQLSPTIVVEVKRARKRASSALPPTIVLRVGWDLNGLGFESETSPRASETRRAHR